MFDTFREPHFFTFSVIFSHIASIFTFSVEFVSHLATFSHIAAFSHLRVPQSWNNRRGIIDNQLRQLCCRRWLSNKPEAVISRTNLEKSTDYSYYNILGQLCKHVLSQFVKGITEYSLTNFRSGTLNLSKLACYFS